MKNQTGSVADISIMKKVKPKIDNLGEATSVRVVSMMMTQLFGVRVCPLHASHLSQELKGPEDGLL